MTVAFKTFGCRLNQAETAQFQTAFENDGIECVPFGTPADIVVFHTCAITQTAEHESLKLIRAVRGKMPGAVLVLAGCVAEAASAETLEASKADLIVRREDKDRLAEIVLRHIGRTPSPATPPIAPPRLAKGRASLKIQDGCNFFCTYCIVPYTRGQPCSRPFDACLEEARKFLAAGFQEIVVTGCNIACYADGTRNLIDLLAALVSLPGLGRLRLGSLEPGTVERQAVTLMADTPKLCRFLHLPIQSGDDGVLSRMKRRYTTAELRDTLLFALDLLPDLALGADFICGFPGETAEAFTRTSDFVRAFPFSKLHVFPYSERPGTPACRFSDAVPFAERRNRTRRLIELGTQKRSAYAQRFTGKRVELVIESYDQQGRARGWSGEHLPCVVEGVPPGRLRTLCAFLPDRVQGDTLHGTCLP